MHCACVGGRTGPLTGGLRERVEEGAVTDHWTGKAQFSYLSKINTIVSRIDFVGVRCCQRGQCWPAGTSPGRIDHTAAGR